ncbi:hypothetical protein [Kitasatospora sp. DSM 101779]|uniref:hypothetical protein n=1 Tax=Kitasatospora sp. DSM 101779 TaxID=2853165 RepID=UPI0021D9003F|nr:hypothetical protein [Kitasatospora sp. DSM 101779]MCU7823940.1 hypothetical protein [Kitasatospora sp. DSM 101779]
MNHNDVARRTEHDLPARSITPKAVACDGRVEERAAPRRLTRALPARDLVREGSR